MLERIEAEIDPLLTLRITASPAGLTAIEFHPTAPAAALNPANPLLLEAQSQLRAYFEGRLREFQLPLDPRGTEFYLSVWRQLQTIPYGQTRSYSWIAQAIGRPTAVRAVGAANGANPIPIVIPCHRVIGVNGKLVGYGGGLPLKRRLLDLEKMEETIPWPTG